MKIVKRLAVVAGVLLVAIQAIRPARTNPPVDAAATIQARAQVPPEIDALLGRYDARRAGRKLDAMCEQVKDGDMPITPYLLLHRSARLSEADRKTLCDWTRAEQGRIAQEQQ
jgi:hypothetical protein